MQGYQGSQGNQGNQGVQGSQGYQGYQGTQGRQGVQGFQGIQGIQGLQGIQGRQGSQGIQGPQGSQGPQGHQGYQGIQGLQGRQGSQGMQGPQGPQGLQGPASIVNASSGQTPDILSVVLDGTTLGNYPSLSYYWRIGNFVMVEAQAPTVSGISSTVFGNWEFRVIVPGGFSSTVTSGLVSGTMTVFGPNFGVTNPNYGVLRGVWTSATTLTFLYDNGADIFNGDPGATTRCTWNFGFPI